MMTRAWRAFVSIALVLALISIHTVQADLVKVGKPVVNPEAKGILATGQNTNTDASGATSIHHDDPSDIPTDYETEIITETIAVTHVVTGGDECEIPSCAVVEICINRNLTHAEIMKGINDINEKLCMDPACTSTDHPFLLVDYYEVPQARGDSKLIAIGSVCNEACLGDLIDSWLTGELCCNLNELLPFMGEGPIIDACCGFEVSGDNATSLIPTPVLPMPSPTPPPNCQVVGPWYNQASGEYEWVCTICEKRFAPNGLGCTDCNFSAIGPITGCSIEGEGYCAYEDIYCNGSFSGEFVVTCPAIDCCSIFNIRPNPQWPGLWMCLPCDENDLCENKICESDQSRTDDTHCTDPQCSNCCGQLRCDEFSCKQGFIKNGLEFCPFDICNLCCLPDLCVVENACDPLEKPSGSALCYERPECDNCCEPLTCAEDAVCGPGLIEKSGAVYCTDEDCSNCCEPLLCEDIDCPITWNPSGLTECVTDSCVFCCIPNLCRDWPCPDGSDSNDNILCGQQGCPSCCSITATCQDPGRTCEPGFEPTGDTDCIDLECSNCCTQKVCPACDPGSNPTGDTLCTDDDCSNCCKADLCTDHTCPSGQQPNGNELCETQDCSDCCEDILCSDVLTLEFCSDGKVNNLPSTPCDDDSCSNCCIQLICADNVCDIAGGEIETGEVNCTSLQCDNCCEQLHCSDYTCFTEGGFVPVVPLPDDCTEGCDNCCEQQFCDTVGCPDGAVNDATDGTPCLDLPDCEGSCCTQLTCAADKVCPHGWEYIPGQTDCTDDTCSNCCSPRVCADQLECGPGFTDSGNTQCTDDECSNCCEQLLCGDFVSQCTDGLVIVPDQTNCVDDACSNCCRQRSCAEKPCNSPFFVAPGITDETLCTDQFCTNCCSLTFCGSYACGPGQEHTNNPFAVCDANNCDNCCSQLFCETDGVCPSGSYATGDTECKDLACSNCCDTKLCSITQCELNENRTPDTNCDDASCDNCCEPKVCGVDSSCQNGLRPNQTETGQPCVDAACSNCCFQKTCDTFDCDRLGFNSTEAVNCTNLFCSNCCKPEFCGQFVCNSGDKKIQGQLLCDPDSCSNCCEPMTCDVDRFDGTTFNGTDRCDPGQVETGADECTDAACSNCCRDRKCSLFRPCQPNEDANGDENCGDNTCSNCCETKTCETEPAGFNRTTVENCTTASCSECCERLLCAQNECSPGEQSSQDVYCEGDDCANCCKSIPCDPTACEQQGLNANATSAVCTDDDCTNCCQPKICAVDRPCEANETASGDTECTTGDDACSNCCSPTACFPIGIDRCNSSLGLFPDGDQSVCVDGECSNCCYKLTCANKSCDEGESVVPDGTQACTDVQCTNCCQQEFCGNTTINTCEGTEVPTGNVQCTGYQGLNDAGTLCDNCCTAGNCSSFECTGGKTPSGDTTCDLDSCGNCCRDLTCDVDHPTCENGFVRDPLLNNCFDQQCSLCCIPKLCVGNAACDPDSGLVRDPDQVLCDTHPDEDCSNCCVQLSCIINRCDILNGEVVDDTGDCTDAQCSNCCRQQTCKDDGSCVAGQILLDEECADAGCTNCCQQLYCDPAGCSDVEQPTGETNCTDTACSNCCQLCNDGVFGPNETCEFLADEDRWIVPPGEGIPSGNDDYDYLSSDLSCDATTCQITPCELEEWQRVCNVQTNVTPTDFEGLEILIPTYDVGLTGIPISGIDISATADIGGVIIVQNGPNANQISTNFLANVLFQVPGLAKAFATTPTAPEKTYDLDPNEILVLSGDDYFATDTQTASVDPSFWDIFTNPPAGSDAIGLMDAESLTSVAGLNIRANISTFSQGTVRIRYKYKWCPTPGASDASELDVGADDQCSDDTPVNPDWNVPGCGDGIVQTNLGEECDGNSGTNDTFYCNQFCLLQMNRCGDGVIYGDEECDYLNGKDIFPEGTPADFAADHRCVKTYDEPIDPPTPCTIVETQCVGEEPPVKTDNEECQFINGTVGLAPIPDGQYCDENCELNKILNCENTNSKVCSCTNLEFTTTYCQTQEATVGGDTCQDANGNDLVFGADDCVTLTGQGACECKCGDGVVQPELDEQCDLGVNGGVINDTYVCTDKCQIQEQFCGDGTVDSIRNEECDPPFSLGGNLITDGDTVQYCDDNCKLQGAVGCDFTEECGQCAPCPNGDRDCTTTINSEEQPPGYLGGCPDGGDFTEGCACDACQGQYIPWVNGQGELRCRYTASTGDCNSLLIFVHVEDNSTTNAGQSCEDVKQPGTWINIGHKKNDLDPDMVAQCDGECQACVEDYGDIQCSTECGSGTQYGIYNITEEPGSAIFNGGSANDLKCQCKNDDGSDCVPGQCVELDEAQCITDETKDLGPGCSCNKNTPTVKWVRECNYVVPEGTNLAAIPLATFDIAKFYREPIEGPSQCLTKTNTLKSNLKSIGTDMVGHIDGTVKVENNFGSQQSVEIKWQDAQLVIKNQDSNEQLVTLSWPDETQAVVVVLQETVEFPFPSKSVSNTFTDNLGDYKTGSSSPAYETVIVDSNDASAAVVGGSNVVITTFGTYGLELTVKYYYTRCDSGGCGPYNNVYNECLPDYPDPNEGGSEQCA